MTGHNFSPSTPHACSQAASATAGQQMAQFSGVSSYNMASKLTSAQHAMEAVKREVKLCKC